MISLVQTSAPDSASDLAYTWYLSNRDEILHIIKTDTRLQALRELESELDLPAGTANRFQELYAAATTVSPQEEQRYAVTWDTYHAALDSDGNLAALAKAYAEKTPMPLHECIDENGTFVF